MASRTLPMDNSLMTQREALFPDVCRTIFEPFLVQFGYSYKATHHRPRGVAVEFKKDENCLFAACEGDVLYVDLILHLEDEEYFRVSLNQAIWFNNVRSLLNAKSCKSRCLIYAHDRSQ